MPCSSCTPGRHGKCVNLSTLQVKTNSLTTAVVVNPIHQFTTSQTSPVSTPEHNKDDYFLNTTEHSDLLHYINQEHPTTTLPPLPPFIRMAIPSFTWGSLSTQSFIDQMSRTYTEVVFRKNNVFTVPLGASGKSFVSELARLFQAYSDGSGLELIALKAITVASRLLLQKPFRTSKAKDHISCLERRLTSWKEGNIDILLLESRTIQQRLPASDSYTHANEDITRSFTKLMFEGNCKAAM